GLVTRERRERDTQPGCATKPSRRNGRPASAEPSSGHRRGRLAVRSAATRRSRSTTRRWDRSYLLWSNPAAEHEPTTSAAHRRHVHPRPTAVATTTCLTRPRTRSPTCVPRPTASPTPRAVASDNGPLAPRAARAPVRHHQSRPPY